MPSQLPAPLTQTLTPKMVQFVEHYVALGGRHQARAAILAGYSHSAAPTVASRLLRRPDVLAYLQHVAETRIKADVIASSETLRELRDSPATPPAIRRQCANDLLDRAGMIVAKLATVTHIVEHRPADRAGDMIQRILSDLFAVGALKVCDPERWQHFLDACNRPIEPSPVTDAEFEEVPAEAEDQVAEEWVGA